MALVHWDPFRALRRRDDAFEDVFRDFFRSIDADGAALEPAAEVAEGESDVTVKLQVPGVDKDQINVSIADDGVTVRGETRKETETKKKSFYRQEIRYGAFQRTIAFPVEVNPDKATAELKNGVLTITAPKTQQPKARQVKVAVG